MSEQKKETDHTCPKCRGALKRIWSNKMQKHYFACQSATEECGAFYPDDGGKPKLPATKLPPSADMPCPECGAPMQRVCGAKHGDFYSCSCYPQCKSTVDCLPDGTPAPVCPADDEHGHMRLRDGRNGRFWSCRTYKETGCNAAGALDGRQPKKKKEVA